MELGPIFDKVGEWITNLSVKLVNLISSWGINTQGLSVKLVAILLILIGLYLASTITKKLAKIGILIVLILLAIAVVRSIFI